MCKFCEGKEPLISKVKQAPDMSFVESLIAEICGNKIVISDILQDNRGPRLIAFGIDCEYCPKCGRDLRGV